MDTLIEYKPPFGLRTVSNREANNPVRRRERLEMIRLGFKTKKAYRRWQKKQRRDKKEKGGTP